jgi:MFS-type transporter involved in bile tolerance (Atg22 family)
MVGKSAGIFGPIVFGELSCLFGNQRPAILSVEVFFHHPAGACSRCKIR